MSQVRDTLSLCFSRSVVRRAAYSALIVGSILILINHSDVLMRGELDPIRLFRIALNVVVPYVVSTVSSVITIHEFR
jgi:hypothetical protein